MTIYILDKPKTSNKELQNIDQMEKTRITALAGYVQNTFETVTKLNHIFKYSHSIMKQIQCLENIKRTIHSQMETSIKSQ